MDEAYDRGWLSIDGNVCAKCVGEDFLASYVLENASSNRCDFCGRTARSKPIAADADEVMTLIATGIYREWTHPVQVMGWVDGDWFGATYDIGDIFYEVGLELGEKFRERVEEAFIDDLWCQAEPYALEPHEVLAHGWQRFAEHVKYHTRYVFLLEKDESEYPDRDEIHPGLMLHRLEDVIRATGIVHPIPEGTRFVRARAHNVDEHPKSASELGTPTPEQATKSNRMSPAGIPMFYGSSDAETALAEMRHDPRPSATLAEFLTLKELRAIDLSRIPDVPSVISQPIAGDDREHIDYVPTQIVTDYFRRIYREEDGSPVDGLLYQSSQHESGECCVLFVEQEQCVDLGEQRGTGILAMDPTSRTQVSLR